MRDLRWSVLAERRFYLWLSAVALLGLFLRCVYLKADPPVWLSWSKGAFTDGAVMVSGARGLLLHNELKAFKEFPLPSSLVFLSYLLFGVGQWQAVVPFVLSGVVSVLIIGLVGRELLGERAGLLVGLLCAVNFNLVVVSRTMLGETLLCTALLLSWYAIERRWEVCSGVLGGVAVFFLKAQGIIFAFAVCSFLVFEAICERRAWRLARWLVGFAIAVAMWEFLQMGSVEEASAQLGSKVRYFVASVEGVLVEPYLFRLLRIGVDTRFASRMPIVSLLALWGLMGCAGSLRRERRLLIPVAWAVTGVIVLSLPPYRPLRHLVQLSLPMLVLAVSTLRSQGEWKPARYLAGVLCFFGVFQILSYLQVGFVGESLWRADVFQRTPKVTYWFVMPSLAVGVVVWWVWERIPKGPVPYQLCLTGVISGVGLFSYYVWDREYTVYQVSEALGRVVPCEAVLGGPMAESVGLQNCFRTFALYRFPFKTPEEYRKQCREVDFLLVPSEWLVGGNGPARVLEALGVTKIRSFWLAGEEQALLRVRRRYEPTMLERALVLLNEKRYEEILGLLPRVRDEALRSFLKAEAEAGLGRTELALSTYEEADRLNKGGGALFDREVHRRIHKAIAQILRDEGKILQARRHWLTAERWKPTGFFW